MLIHQTHSPNAGVSLPATLQACLHKPRCIRMPFFITDLIRICFPSTQRRLIYQNPSISTALSMAHQSQQSQESPVTHLANVVESHDGELEQLRVEVCQLRRHKEHLQSGLESSGTNAPSSRSIPHPGPFRSIRSLMHNTTPAPRVADQDLKAGPSILPMSSSSHSINISNLTADDSETAATLVALLNDTSRSSAPTQQRPRSNTLLPPIHVPSYAAQKISQPRKRSLTRSIYRYLRSRCVLPIPE